MNESIEELLASGAVVPDRPGSKRLVPAAQSVVVPREALDLFDRTMRDANVSFYHAARQTMHELLSAAPAPSSLAGGAREAVARIVDPLLFELVEALDNAEGEPEALRRDASAMRDARMAEVFAKADRILAALSPEAPARDGVDSLVDRFAAALKDKLHAAAAKYGHDDAWMRDDWRADLIRQLGEHVQKGDPRDVAAYCAFAWHHGWSVGSISPLTENDEAPAEGAGDGMDAYTRPDTVEALRARSSAPEAREGVAAGWRWRFDNDLSESMWFYGHVVPERPENAINTIVEIQPLYTHPAAPSADKLRSEDQ